jgi:hypothetical protein
MTQLLLTPNDGGTAWRHALAPGEHRAGWECLGPNRLASRVGQLLGIPVQLTSGPERLTAYAARLDADEQGGRRSYSRSRENDPFGVAGFLLGLRDRLRLAGWTGTPLDGSARLGDLCRLEQRPERLPPGLPDVLPELTAALRQASAIRPAAGVRIQLAAPRAAYAPAVRALLDALAAAGATVLEAPVDVPIAPPGSDLGRLQAALAGADRPRAELRGDGSVLFLEADTPLEAAELCADLLRARPIQETALLPAAEPEALDAALARQGLPTLGLDVASALRPHLQVLPLRLALAFSPQEPFRAAELLLLPGGPLPGHARTRLLDALAEMPGIGSPAWRTAVADACAEEERRALEGGESEAAAKARAGKLQDRIERWYGGELADAAKGIRAAHAAGVVQAVAAWLGARAGEERDEDAEVADEEGAWLWGHAASVARTLTRMLLSRPPDELLSPVALMQLHELAVAAGAERTPWPPQAGRPAVALHAADLVPGAGRVVWWGFVQDVELGPAPDAWTVAEQAALAAAGVTLPGPGEARAIEAWAWRRAVLAAKESVVFVRWRLSGTEVIQPHPFADELETRVEKGGLARGLATSEALLAGRGPWQARTCPLGPAGAIKPRKVWHADGLAVGGTQSATQLKTLLGCPFYWALRYAGELRKGRALELPDGDELLGNFAHAILQDLLVGPEPLAAGAGEPEARAWAERAFDARVATEAAPLVLRGKELELDRARGLVGTAAAALVRYLRDGDWVALAAEQELQGEFAGHPVAGRADLVVQRRRDGARAVIDLKLSGFDYRRRELEKGRGLQLALYASMLGRSEGRLPPAAYLVLDGGHLLTLDARAFPGAVGVDGPSPEVTLAEARAALERWKQAFAAGALPVTKEKSGWEDEVRPIVGELPDRKSAGRYEPECGFCPFGTLCDVELGAEVA